MWVRQRRGPVWRARGDPCAWRPRTLPDATRGTPLLQEAEPKRRIAAPGAGGMLGAGRWPREPHPPTHRPLHRRRAPSARMPAGTPAAGCMPPCGAPRPQPPVVTALPGRREPARLPWVRAPWTQRRPRGGAGRGAEAARAHARRMDGTGSAASRSRVARTPGGLTYIAESWSTWGACGRCCTRHPPGAGTLRPGWPSSSTAWPEATTPSSSLGRRLRPREARALLRQGPGRLGRAEVYYSGRCT